VIQGVALSATGDGPITRTGAREDARHELSKAVYHRYDDPWPVRAFRWVMHQISQLLDHATRHTPGGGLGALLIVVIVLVLLAVARWRLGPMQRQHRTAAPLLTDAGTSAADHRRLAERAAAGGDWTEAVRERMRAVARELEERDVVDARPGRTATELAREVAVEVPAIAAPVQQAVATFEAVVYGHRRATRESYDVLVAADAVLTQRRLTSAGRS